jgi:hypothetical protein
MIHSVPNSDRVAAPWALTNRWLDWFCETSAAVLRRGWRLCGLGNDTPELWMSQEWLDEYQRRSREHPDGA